MVEYLYDRDKKKNIVGKEENAGSQHFLPFPQCFQNPCPHQIGKTRDCVAQTLNCLLG